MVHNQAEIAYRSRLLTRAFLKGDYNTVDALTSDSNLAKSDGVLRNDLLGDRRRFRKWDANVPIDTIDFAVEYRGVCMYLSAAEGPTLTDWIGNGRYAHSGVTEVMLRVNHRQYRQIWMLNPDGKWRCMFLPLDLDENFRNSIVADLRKSGGIL